MNSAEEVFDAANTAEDAGRIEEARALWQGCVAVAPQNGRAWLRYGRFLLDQEEWQAAVDALAHVWTCRNIEPRLMAKAWACSGLCQRELKQIQAAEFAFRRSLELKPNAHVFVFLASLLWRSHREDEAIEVVQEAIRLDPAHDEAHYNLGSYHFWKDEFEAAEKYFRLAIELGYEEARVYDGLGQSLMRQKDHDKAEAKRILEKAVALGSDDPWTRVYLANLSWDIEDLDEAEAHYQVLLELVGHGELEGLACWTYGDFLSSTKRDLDRADKMLHRAVELDSDDGYAFYVLGEHLERDYRFDETRAAFEAAARLGHKDARQRLDEMDEF